MSEHRPSKTGALEYALRQGNRCRNYGPERVENEDVIVILADEVERLQQDVARYESGRVVLTGEIEELKKKLSARLQQNEELRMAERLNVETVARLQQERDQWASIAGTDAGEAELLRAGSPPSDARLDQLESFKQMIFAGCTNELYCGPHPHDLWDTVVAASTKAAVREVPDERWIKHDAVETNGGRGE